MGPLGPLPKKETIAKKQKREKNAEMKDKKKKYGEMKREKKNRSLEHDTIGTAVNGWTSYVYCLGNRWRLFVIGRQEKKKLHKLSSFSLPS